MDMTDQFSDRESFINWFLIAALSGVEITDKVRSEPRMVTMQLNGVEINPLAALKRLEEQFDRVVSEEAKKLFEEKQRAIFSPFEDKIREMSECVSSIIEQIEAPRTVPL